MTDKFVSLHTWYDQLQRSHTRDDIVEKIRNRLKSESDQESTRLLAFILAGEFREQGRYEEAEHVLLDLSERDQAEPYPLISLAGQKLYDEQKPDEALGIVDKAIKRARASRTFRRNALGVKARIAEK